MKRFFGIINLILCFELIVGPNFPGLKVFSLSSARAETCPAGLVFDSVLNRCITSDQQAEIINASASCNGDKECYKRIAEEKLKEAEADGKIPKEVANKGGLINTVGKIAAIAGPLTVVMASFKNKKCLNASGMAMIAGGVAFTAGNFLADRKHKSCLKKISAEWEKKKAENTETTQSGITKVSNAQAQSEAFEMLAKKEECMESAAKMKGGFYAASTLAFAGAAVLALMMNPQEEAPCSESDVPAASTGGIIKVNEYKIASQTLFNIQNSEEIESLLINSQSFNPERKSCASIEDYELLKKEFPIKNQEEKDFLLSYLKEAYQGIKNEMSLVSTAHADAEVLSEAGAARFDAAAAAETSATTTTTTTTAASGASPLGGILGKLNSRMGRAIMGGVLAGLSAMMWMHARKQAKAARNRAEFLRGMKEEFNDAMGAISCTAEERSMSANANCYCYTESGQRNSARGNSAVCQQLWAGTTPGGPGTYNPLDFSNQMVCVAANGTPDENCACKQTRNCMNSIPNLSGNLGVGAISVATNGMKPLNDLVNGQVGAGSINGAGVLSAAAKLLDQRNKLLDKAKLNPNQRKKSVKEIEDALIASAGSAPSPLASSSSSLPMNMTGADAARILEKELGSGRTFEKVNGSPAVAQPGNSAVADEGFSLGTPDAVAPTTDQQVAEVMAQDFNYNQNDITKSDSNLFQILSNRYQQSGMRRLFTEGGKASPEPANKNDISQ